MKRVPEDVLDETLARMEALVRDRPTITVRELASRLGFAEERSIYYWLKKAGYQGIREFRTALLRRAGAGEAGEKSSLPGPNERSSALDKLPARTLTPVWERQGSPSVREAAEPFQVGAGQIGGGGDDSRSSRQFEPARIGPAPDVTWLPSLGSDAYALTVDHPGYAPVLHRGDLLLIDPGDKWRDGDLVVVERAGGSTVIGRAYGAQPTLLVHLVRPTETLELKRTGAAAPHRISRVVQLIRSFR